MGGIGDWNAEFNPIGGHPPRVQLFRSRCMNLRRRDGRFDIKEDRMRLGRGRTCGPVQQIMLLIGNDVGYSAETTSARVDKQSNQLISGERTAFEAVR
jgi:hypothetical protein